MRRSTNRFYYLRYYIAGPLHYYSIPDVDIFLVYLILIMEGCSTYHHTPDVNGFHQCDGSQDAGPAYLNNNIFDNCSNLCRREFACNSPPGTSRNGTETILDIHRIDLDDRAIYLVGKSFTSGDHIAVISYAIMYVFCLFYIGIYGEAPVCEALQKIPVCPKGYSIGKSNGIAEDTERPFRGNP